MFLFYPIQSIFHCSQAFEGTVSVSHLFLATLHCSLEIACTSQLSKRSLQRYVFAEPLSLLLHCIAELPAQLLVKSASRRVGSRSGVVTTVRTSNKRHSRACLRSAGCQSYSADAACINDGAPIINNACSNPGSIPGSILAFMH